MWRDYRDKIAKGIVYKLNLATLVCALIISSFIALYYYEEMTERTEHQVNYEIAQVSVSLRLALEASTDFSNMRRVINGLAAQGSIKRLVLFDPREKQIVADNLGQYLGSPLMGSLEPELAEMVNHVSDKQRSKEVWREGSMVHQVQQVYLIAPELQRLRAYVLYVSYDASEIEAYSFEELIHYVGILLLGFAILLTVNLYVQHRVLLEPIGRIRRQIETFGGQKTINLDSEDEFGVLVNSYNEAVIARNQKQFELQKSRRYIDNITNVIPIQLAYVDAQGRYRFINKHYLQWLGKTEEEVLEQKVEAVLPRDVYQLIKPYQLEVLAGNKQVFEVETLDSDRAPRFFHVTYVPDVGDDGMVEGYFICVEDLTRMKINERKIESYAQEMEFSNLALSEAREKAEVAAKTKEDFLACMSHEIRTPMNGVIGILDLLSETQLSPMQKRYVDVASGSADSLLSLLNDILDFSKIESGKFEIEAIEFDLVELLDLFVQSVSLKLEERNLPLFVDVTQLDFRFVVGDPSRLRQILVNLVGNAIKFTEEGWITLRLSNCLTASGEVLLSCEVEDTGIGIAEEKLAMLFNPFIQVDSSTTRMFGGTGLGLSIAKRLCELMRGDIKVKSQQEVGSIFSFTLTQQLPDGDRFVDWREGLSPARVTIMGQQGAFERMLGDLLSSWGARVNYLKEEAAIPETDVTIYSFAPQHEAFDEELSVWRQLADHHKAKVLPLLSYWQQIEFEKRDARVAHLGKPLNIRQLIRALSDQPYDDVSESAIEPIVETGLPDKPKVLVVEDNKVNQMVALGMLQQLGVEADVAGNGREALEVLSAQQGNPYQLILMDCLMPEMDGFHATAAIREGVGGRQFCAVPIIALTANAMKGDREHCMRAGMDDYLTKPLVLGDLKECLYRWFSLSQQNYEVTLGHDPDPIEAPAAAETANPLFDRDSALALMSGDEALLGEVLQVFAEEMQRHRQGFIEGIAAADCDAIRTSVHAIKGAASNLSMIALVELARQVEADARRGDLQAVLAGREAFLELLEDTLACCH
ncbi:ATP-binding protein [Shewanella insulae]|uniref:hybrid sensor histidine kinase/response regulator n=1 Tax=Shewanella insulae TaxID=2681496 RepID=UPI001EFD1669|nr:ATP-binding protein [Shewanella insulae]MCG9714060.1 ATP-binding protein [Shewanella insulae]